MRTILPVLALVLFLPVATSAQELFVTGHFGVGSIQEQQGFAYGLGGAAVLQQRFAGFVLLDALTFSGEGDSRYYWDTLSNGEERCRDSATGQFARSSLCGDSETLLGLLFDANYAHPIGTGQLMLGGGYRIGDGATPYGAVGYAFNPLPGMGHWFIRGLIGDGFFQAQLAGSFRVR